MKAVSVFEEVHFPGNRSYAEQVRTQLLHAVLTGEIDALEKPVFVTFVALKTSVPSSTVRSVFDHLCREDVLCRRQEGGYVATKNGKKNARKLARSMGGDLQRALEELDRDETKISPKASRNNPPVCEAADSGISKPTRSLFRKTSASQAPHNSITPQNLKQQTAKCILQRSYGPSDVSGAEVNCSLSRMFSDLFPWMSADSRTIDCEDLPFRLIKLFQKNGVTRWCDLATRTLESLFQWPDCDEKSLTQLIDRIKLFHARDSQASEVLSAYSQGLGTSANPKIIEPTATAIHSAEDGLTYLDNQEFVTIFPWMANSPDDINMSHLSVRLGGRLEEAGITKWSHLANLTPGDILRLHGIGRQSISELLTYANAEEPSIDTQGKHSYYSLHIPSDATKQGNRPERNVDVLSSLAENISLLSHFSLVLENFRTLGEALSYPQQGLPQEIIRATEAVREFSFSNLIDPAVTQIDLCEVVSLLLSQVPPRSREVFFRRSSLSGSSTLEQIAADLNLTRERVRQLEKKTKVSLKLLLKKKEHRLLRWAIHIFRSRVGAAFPYEGETYRKARDQLIPLVRGFGSEDIESLFLFLAGPYKFSKNRRWLHIDSFPDATIVNEHCNEFGIVDIERLFNSLETFGLVQSVFDSWMTQIGELRRIGDDFAIWGGSIGNKAATVLFSRDKPLTIEEIVQEIGEGHSIGSARNQIYADPRLMRTSKDKVGLRIWGLEEYTKISEEIEQQIERNGGEADIEAVVDSLVRQFGVSANSVRSYCTSPAFVVEKGTIRKRPPNIPFENVSRVESTKNCFHLWRDTLSFRFPVDSELLRGSGRSIPIAIGHWLGLEPGQAQTLTCEENSLTIKWRKDSAAGLQISSLRTILTEANAEAGQYFVLRLRRDVGTFSLVRTPKINISHQSPLRHLGELVGLDKHDGEHDILKFMAKALDCGQDESSVRRALYARGESELAELLTSTANAELSNLFNSMERLL